MNWSGYDEGAHGDIQTYRIYYHETGRFSDATDLDGTYAYAIAGIRSENGQEAESALGDPVSVDTDALAPAAPQNLSLQLTPQGILAQWEPCATPESVTYRLYRSDAAQITTVEGLSVLESRIRLLWYTPYSASAEFEGRQDHVATVGSAVDETSESKAEVKARLSGEVRVNFKSDYLPLDKMATPEMISTIQGNSTPYNPNPSSQEEAR